MHENNPGEPRLSFIKSVNPFVYAVIVLAVIFFLYQIIGVTIVFASGAEDIGANVSTIRIILAFGQFMLILAPTIFFSRLQNPEIKNTFRLRAPSAGILFLSLAGIILVQPMIQGYMYFQDYMIDNLPVFSNSISSFRDLFNEIDSSSRVIFMSHSIIEFLVVIFVICLTPGICEESLFRGFVLKNIEKVAKPSVSVFMTGFLFAIYHFHPFNLVPLVVLGVYLSFVVYCSNSIYTGVACHFLNNLSAVYLLYVSGNEEFTTPSISASETFNNLIMSGLSLMSFAVIIYYIYRFRTIKAEEAVI